MKNINSKYWKKMEKLMGKKLILVIIGFVLSGSAYAAKNTQCSNSDGSITYSSLDNGEVPTETLSFHGVPYHSAKLSIEFSNKTVFPNLHGNNTPNWESYSAVLFYKTAGAPGTDYVICKTVTE